MHKCWNRNEDDVGQSSFIFLIRISLCDFIEHKIQVAVDSSHHKNHAKDPNILFEKSKCELDRLVKSNNGNWIEKYEKYKVYTECGAGQNSI